ncbi:MAG: response regulator [Chloroflexi bacterium]|nr:response regulator [Chloroflexota bacterium]
MDNKVILLVEDNPKDVELTQRALKKSNIANKLIIAQDGVEALKYFFGEDGKSGWKTEELPVVVLLDLKLPRVDGIEVLHRIRAEAKTRRVPVVVLTSSNEERDIVASYNLGANSYVRKPVKFSEFADAIGHLGLYWLILNQPPLNGKY